jgi:hypothetical protein
LGKQLEFGRNWFNSGTKLNVYQSAVAAIICIIANVIKIFCIPERYSKVPTPLLNLIQGMKNLHGVHFEK